MTRFFFSANIKHGREIYKQYYSELYNDYISEGRENDAKQDVIR